MISSILAFAAGLAAKIKPERAPVLAKLDLARALIDARAELAEAQAAHAKARAEHDEAMRVLNLTREARDAARAQRDHANAQCRAMVDRNHVLERQRADLAVQLGRLTAAMPFNPSRFPPLAPPDAQIESQRALDAPRWPPSPFGVMLADPELWRDCTCVPGRADAFRNPQANVR